MIIVIAWITMDGLEPTGRQIRYDGYNSRAEMQSVPLVRTVAWLVKGTADDLVKAEAYASANGYSMLTYPTDEYDPLNRAKADMLERFKAGAVAAIS